MRPITLVDIFRSQGSWSLKGIKWLDHVLGFVAARCLASPQAGSNVASPGPARGLIIRPGGIGDAVLLLPVLRELRSAGHTFDILCERRNAAVFRSQSGLCDRVFCYNSVADLNAVCREAYDWIVDTEQWHYLSAVLSRLLCSRSTAGFATRPDRARLFSRPVDYVHAEYELHNFSRLFAFLGVRTGLRLKGAYEIHAQDAAWAQAALSRPYAALALGGSSAARRFSLDQLAATARLIIDRGLDVVLLGGRDMEGAAGEVMARLNNPAVVSFAGKTSLEQSAALIARAACFIGQDSGLLHMAAALAVPVVAVFGPGNKKKWFPEGAGTVPVTLDLACSPCTLFGYCIVTCRGQYPCLRAPELTERLLKAVDQILPDVRRMSR